MVSLVCWIRGDRRCVDRFLDELQAKYLKFEYQETDKKGNFIDGTKKDYLWPISIRYCFFGTWEIVFPKEHTDKVLTTLFGKSESFKSIRWKSHTNFMRLALKLEKIPQYKDAEMFPIFRNGIEIIPIGFKKDLINSSRHENL